MSEYKTIDHSTDEQKIRWYEDRTTRDRLEHYGYPHFFVSFILRGTDAAKLVELHREKAMVSAYAFDTRVKQNGFDPDNLTEVQRADVEFELENWEEYASEDPEDLVTLHLKRWEELYDQIKAILEPCKYAWWEMSILNKAARD